MIMHKYHFSLKNIFIFQDIGIDLEDLLKSLFNSAAAAIGVENFCPIFFVRCFYIFKKYYIS